MKNDKPKRFRDFLKQWSKLPHTEPEKKMGS